MPKKKNFGQSDCLSNLAISLLTITVRGRDLISIAYCPFFHLSGPVLGGRQLGQG